MQLFYKVLLFLFHMGSAGTQIQTFKPASLSFSLSACLFISLSVCWWVRRHAWAVNIYSKDDGFFRQDEQF